MADGNTDRSRHGEVPPAKTIELGADGSGPAGSDTVQVEALHTDRVRYVGGAAPVPPRAPRRGPSWAGPTIDLPAEMAPAYVDAGGRPPRRRRWWLAGLLAVVVVIGAVLILLQFRTDQTPAAQTVRAYFADLANGDTGAAMKLVDNPGDYTSAANPLLSGTALSKAANRPSAATVARSSATSTGGGQSSTSVTVTYTVDGTQVQQTIMAIGSSSEGYRLKAPFITVAVSGAKNRPVKVNGVGFPADATQLLAFPGAYSATVSGTALIAPATAQATYDSASGAVKADIWLPAPEIADGATAAVQAAVNHALDTCAASTAAQPAGCPFRYDDSGADLKWKIAAYPKVKAKAGADGTVTFDDGGHLATVHYEATTGGFLGLFPRTKSGDMGVDVAGTATVTSDGVAVTFG